MILNRLFKLKPKKLTQEQLNQQEQYNRLLASSAYSFVHSYNEEEHTNYKYWQLKPMFENLQTISHYMEELGLEVYTFSLVTFSLDDQGYITFTYNKD